MLHVDFVKMHGLLNSFILISDFSQLLPPARCPELARSACSSQGGIGADGLVILRPGKGEANFIMDFFNADGSQAEMCGNAVRCLAKYVEDAKLLPAVNSRNSQSPQQESKVSFQTLAGLITTRLIENREWDAMVSVDMGIPIFDPNKKLPQGLEYRGHTFTSVSMGNPHAVTLLRPDQDDFDYRELGEALQRETRESFFPEGVNVEFVKPVAEDRLEVRVIERGVGETLACGTGACAAAVVYLKNQPSRQPQREDQNRDGHSVNVHLLGGDLTIRWGGGLADSIEMIGPAHKVAFGTYAWEGWKG